MSKILSWAPLNLLSSKRERNVPQRWDLGCGICHIAKALIFQQNLICQPDCLGRSGATAAWLTAGTRPLVAV